MWYRPLLKSATCLSDSLGPPSNVESMQDVVNVAVLLPSNTSGVTIEVYSRGNQIGSFAGVAGLNAYSVPGMVAGAQSVQLVSSDRTVISSAKSMIDVAATTTGICNFNYQVIGVY
ncbi:glycoside hydrolase [Penicillium taxi]|uniref:glycoside hydrolase n=1 Tax=Penicillium taxi TaxID=168475 RepID=UPI0025453D2E|nr:glycoside hydrolase [Penicillium taxi]KAJ5898879.1 glycoside hydrolase [Penicillium taxi]